MELSTKNFGLINYDEDKIITFKSGLPGFKYNTKYILIDEEDSEFVFLQSIEDGDLTFILIDLTNFMEDYNPEVKEEQLQDLGKVGNNLAIYNVCSFKENVEDITVNLMAPVVINIENNTGCQVIAENSQYSIKHKLFQN